MYISIGTVTVGLSRARQAFRGALDNELYQSGIERTTKYPNINQTRAVSGVLVFRVPRVCGARILNLELRHLGT